MSLAPLSPSLLVIALASNLVLATLAFRRGSVSRSGYVVGSALGILLFWFGGLGAYLVLLGFFVLGTSATRWGWSKKSDAGLAQEEQGRRGSRHALANCGVGLTLALAIPFVAHPAVGIALAAAFATALSDTLGSEIGQVYGRRPFLITSFRRVPPGTEGAVSVEGTAAGIAGSGVIGGLGWAGGLYPPLWIAAVALGAFVGTTVESYVGAIWGRQARIGNEAMNFLNTVVGAAVGAATYLLLG